MKTREKKESNLTHADLEQFTGTTQYYRYSPLFRQMVLTDGTRYLAEAGECYWLFDRIASLQIHPDIKNHPELQTLQFWWLDVREGQTGILTCEWHKDKIVYSGFQMRTVRASHSANQPEISESETALKASVIAA